MKKNARRVRKKVIGIAGSFSGAIGILGSWQVCHNLCLALITGLSILGITVVGMPLLFLQKLQLPFWIAATALLGIAVVIYFRMRCISGKLIFFNAGLVIAGFPFQGSRQINPVFWIMGGTLALFSIMLLLKDKHAGGVGHAKGKKKGA